MENIMSVCQHREKAEGKRPPEGNKSEIRLQAALPWSLPASRAPRMQMEPSARGHRPGGPGPPWPLEPIDGTRAKVDTCVRFWGGGDNSGRECP